jgi:hypothetical protein
MAEPSSCAGIARKVKNRNGREYGQLSSASIAVPEAGDR